MAPSAAISAAMSNSRRGRSITTAPALESRATARWKAAATAVVETVEHDRLRHTAMRRPATGRARPRWVRDPARPASRRRQQATERASGPSVSSVGESGTMPAIGWRPVDGLKPVRPHSAAGTRTEPAVSVPMPATAMPSVTETAAPEDEPPGMRAASRS